MGTGGMNHKIPDIQSSVNTTSCKFVAECKRMEGRDEEGAFPCFIICNNTIFVKIKFCM